MKALKVFALGTALLVSFSATAATIPFDIQFLDTMAAHQKQGAQLSELAARKTQSGDIRILAQKMTEDHEADVSDLAALHRAAARYIPVTINIGLPGGKPINTARLKNASEETFDRMFLDMIIGHHKDSIALANSALKNASQPAVRAEAQNIAAKQAAELKNLQEIRKRF